MIKNALSPGVIVVSAVIVVGFIWTLLPVKEHGVTFSYPEKLTTLYISTAEWPPQIKVLKGPYSCTSKNERVIDGKKFCVTKQAEGAAGSTYTTYTYVSQLDGKVTSLTFTLRAVQCSNYDEPKASECFLEQASFSADNLFTKIHHEGI